MLTRLTRLGGNPWLRCGLLGLIIVFCAYGLHAEWPQVTAGLARLHWYSVVLSLAAAISGTTAMMLAWRAVLASFGSPLPVIPAAKISFVAQLGKYLPGAVWSFAAQVELGHDLGVPRRRSVASFAVSLAVTLGVGLGVAAIALPLASPQLARQYWWVLAGVPLIVVCLCPPVLGRVINRLFTLTRRQPLERQLTWSGLGRAAAWTVAGWLLLGGQVWFVLSSMTGHRGGLLLATGGYALAFCVGLLLIIFPSGIGARDLILIAALATVVPHGTAVAIAVVTRVITTGSDLACGSFGLALSRAARRRQPAALAPLDQAGRAAHAGQLRLAGTAAAGPGRHRKAGLRPTATASGELPGGARPAHPAETAAS